MSEEKAQIVLGEATVESGAPALKPRAGGATGPRESKYDSIIEKAKLLEKGQGFVRVPLNGAEPVRAIGALRTVLKRKELKDLKVRELADGGVGIFRP